jgi:hypothetical protein
VRLIPVIGFVLSLSACGDPLAGVDRLSDVDVADTGVAAALPDAQEVAREGFIGTAAAQNPAPAGRVLQGWIRRAADPGPAAPGSPDVDGAQPQGDTATDVGAPATPAPEAPAGAQDAATDAAPRKQGLFGAPSSPQPQVSRNGPDARDVPFGTLLAFGEIARVCEARGQSLGQRVDSNGQRGFALYDSAPGTGARRTFYVTGFGDECPRQFTAANALFGAPSFYEQIRFGPAGENLPVAATDAAYDTVKSSVCRVAGNTPCGARLDSLDASTAFVSAYEFAEINTEWKEFLVHDGTVVAAAVKSVN